MCRYCIRVDCQHRPRSHSAARGRAIARAARDLCGDLGEPNTVWIHATRGLCVAGDRNGDGIYDETDVRQGMAEYGIIEASDCQGDVNGDGIVNAADLGIVIGVWGNCP